MLTAARAPVLSMLNTVFVFCILHGCEASQRLDLDSIDWKENQGGFACPRNKCGIDADAPTHGPKSSRRPQSLGSDMLQRRTEVSTASLTQISESTDSTVSKISTLRCDADCVIPAGEKWLLDASLQVETLTIYGTLEWDRSKDNLELRANYVLVEDGGHFILGTVDSPMNLAATVYITNGPHSDPELGRRFLGGRGTGQKLG